MKILCVQGSPNKSGNSSLTAQHFCKAAAEIGAEIETFHLNSLDYKGCQGCYSCKMKLDHCAVEDGITPVLNKIHDADLVVLSTPVYAFEMSGQMKLFLDRLFSLLGPNYAQDPNDIRIPAGKNLVFIQSQGHDDADAYPQIFKDISQMFKMIQFDRIESLIATAVLEPGKVMEKTEFLVKTAILAEELTAN